MKTAQLLLAWAFAWSLVALPAWANEPYFKGKTIELVVPSGPGGSYASFAELVSLILPRHIPGAPRIAPNFVDGAGGIKASNYFENLAAKDGTALYLVHQNAATAELVDPGMARYHVGQLQAVGILSAMNSVMVARKDVGVASIADAREREVLIGATGRGSYQYIAPSLLNGLKGAKFNIVASYGGTTDTMLALERGEIGALFISTATLAATHPDWLDGSGLARPVLQIGLAPDPALPHVPLLTELAANETEAAVFTFISAPSAMARSLALPAGTSGEIVELFRRAFAELIADPDFVAGARGLRLPLVSADAARQKEIVANILATSPEVVDRIRKLMTER